MSSKTTYLVSFSKDNHLVYFTSLTGVRREFETWSINRSFCVRDCTLRIKKEDLDTFFKVFSNADIDLDSILWIMEGRGEPTPNLLEFLRKQGHECMTMPIDEIPTIINESPSLIKKVLKKRLEEG